MLLDQASLLRQAVGEAWSSTDQVMRVMRSAGSHHLGNLGSVCLVRFARRCAELAVVTLDPLSHRLCDDDGADAAYGRGVSAAPLGRPI
jgi:hypothetical protein